MDPEENQNVDDQVKHDEDQNMSTDSKEDGDKDKESSKDNDENKGILPTGALVNQIVLQYLLLSSGHLTDDLLKQTDGLAVL